MLTQLPTPGQMAVEVKTDVPDLSASHARGNIVDYIYDVTPGLAIPIVFGLTRPFRQTLCKTFVPKRWQDKNQTHEEQGKQAGEWVERVAAAPAVPGSLHLDGQEPCVPGTLDSRPVAVSQDRVKEMNTGLPVDDESSYELSEGTEWQKTPGTAEVKNTRTRPRSAESTASLDPLLEAEHQRGGSRVNPSAKSAPKVIYLKDFEGISPSR